jgi:hypothetical protein
MGKKTRLVPRERVTTVTPRVETNLEAPKVARAVCWLRRADPTVELVRSDPIAGASWSPSRTASCRALSESETVNITQDSDVMVVSPPKGKVPQRHVVASEALHTMRAAEFDAVVKMPSPSASQQSATDEGPKRLRQTTIAESLLKAKDRRKK